MGFNKKLGKKFKSVKFPDSTPFEKKFLKKGKAAGNKAFGV